MTGRSRLTTDDERQIVWLVEHDNVHPRLVASQYRLSTRTVYRVLERMRQTS